MTATAVVYRLVVVTPGAAAPFAVGDVTVSDEHFWVTSSRDGADHNYIVEPPSDDGDLLDPLTSTVADAAAQVVVSDVQQAGGGGGITGYDPLYPGAPPSGWVQEGEAGTLAPGYVGPDGDSTVFFSIILGVGSPSPAPSYGQVAKTFTGFTPGVAYQVTLVAQQNPRTSPGGGSMAPGNGVRCLVQATVDSGTVQGFGIELDSVVPGGASSGWESVSVTVTVGATGTIRVGAGWYSTTGVYFIGSVNIDSVTIDPVSSLPAGRYVTLWLADTGARYQLLGREAFLEYSTDGQASWALLRSGYVTDLELTRAQTYSITIGGARRRERNTRIGALYTPAGPQFRPTALFGTPIYLGLNGYMSDYGLVRFVVTGNAPGDTTGWVILERQSSWWYPPSLFPGGGGYYDVNRAARPFYVDTPGQRVDMPNGSDRDLRGEFSQLVAYVYAAADNAFVTTATPYGFDTPHGRIISTGSELALRWQDDDIDTVAPVGTEFLVLVVPTAPSEDFPLWYQGHPALLIDNALTAIDVAIDATAYNAALAALGADLIITGQLTDPAQTVAEFIDSLCAFVGLTVTLATNSNARRLVVTRDRVGLSDGVATLTEDDLRGFGSVPTWTLSASSRRNVITATIRQLYLWTFDQFTGFGTPTLENRDRRPPSMMATFDAPYEIDYTSDGVTPDRDIYGSQSLDLAIVGSPGIRLRNTTAGPTPLNGAFYIQGIAQRLFDRFARGAPETGLTLAGPFTAGTIGDVIVDATVHQPNAQPGRDPSAQRGGLRPRRIIGHTREPAGDVLRCIDEGSGVPCSVPFTLAVAVSAVSIAQGQYVLTITVSNVLALQAVGALLDVYFALTPDTAASPTDSGVHVGTIDLRAATSDTYAVDMGFIPPNNVAWISAEAWIPGGSPGARSYWYAETGPDDGTLPPPVTPPAPPGVIASLTFPTISSNYVIAAWTNSDTTSIVRVISRVTGTTPWTLLLLLGPRSIQITLLPLLALTEYDVEVSLMDVTSTTPVGTTLADTVTTIAGAGIVLAEPTSPRAFSGYVPGASISAPDAVGMTVTLPTVPYPHEIVFQMVAETAVGSGIPDPWPVSVTAGGGFQQGKTAFIGDVFAVWYFIPNDGRLRFFRAQAYSATYTPSAWTPIVSVMPWGGILPALVGTTRTSITALALDGTGATGIDGTTGTITLTATSQVSAWRVEANSPCRLRLYTDAASRTADLTRAINTAYAPASGLALEVVLPTTEPSLILVLSPPVPFGPASAGSLTLYYTLANTYPAGTLADLLVYFDTTAT